MNYLLLNILMNNLQMAQKNPINVMFKSCMWVGQMTSQIYVISYQATNTILRVDTRAIRDDRFQSLEVYTLRYRSVSGGQGTRTARHDRCFLCVVVFGFERFFWYSTHCREGYTWHSQDYNLPIKKQLISGKFQQCHLISVASRLQTSMKRDSSILYYDQFMHVDFILYANHFGRQR